MDDASSFMPPRAFNIPPHRWRASHFWGLEPMTRLLRVSHQIGDEAAEVLFSNLKFYWPTCTTKSHVQGSLKPLDARARGLVQSVQVHMAFPTMKHRKDEWIDAITLRWKLAIAWLSWLLPGLKKVEVELEFWCKCLPAQDEKAFELTAKLVLNLLSPFQELEFNALKVKAGKDDERGNRGELAREIDARIQSGIW